MEWARLAIGGRVRLRLPAGRAGDEPVEVCGRLLGRDRSKFIEFGVDAREQDPNDFRAVVRLDDGTVILAALDSVIGRET